MTDRTFAGYVTERTFVAGYLTDRTFGASYVTVTDRAFVAGYVTDRTFVAGSVPGGRGSPARHTVFSVFSTIFFSIFDYFM